MKPLLRLPLRLAPRASYAALLASLLLVVLGHPLAVSLGLSFSWVLPVLFVIVLMACVAAALRERRSLVFLLVAAFAGEVVVSIVGLGHPALEAALQHGLRCLVLGVTAAILLRDLFRARSAELDTILGAICVYLLLALAWSQAYAIVDGAAEGAFLVAGESASLDATETLYFSFVTLTTLGYGDVVPRHEVARALAVLEATVGLLYVAIVIARLVTLYDRGRPEEEDAA